MSSVAVLQLSYICIYAMRAVVVAQSLSHPCTHPPSQAPGRCVRRAEKAVDCTSPSLRRRRPQMTERDMGAPFATAGSTKLVGYSVPEDPAGLYRVPRALNGRGAGLPAAVLPSLLAAFHPYGKPLTAGSD